jgi:hypothetical protein
METTTNPPTSTLPPLKQWTPELTLQAFKEGVTALLGLILVIALVILAWRTYVLLGAPIDDGNAQLMAQKVTWAKDILILLLGPSGVVLGYYFGRVPAEAHAAQAQKQADSAASQAQTVSAQAETVAAQAEKVIGAITSFTPPDSAERGAGVARDSAVVSDLQRLRDELRNLGRMARQQP